MTMIMTDLLRMSQNANYTNLHESHSPHLLQQAIPQAQGKLLSNTTLQATLVILHYKLLW